jgi:ribonuclease P/MRP protein subunit POP5
MTPLGSAHREKKRYVAFKVMSEAPLTKKDVTRAILNEALNFFGECRFSDFSLWVEDFDEKSSRGFLICNREFKDEVIACLSLIGSVDMKKASFVVLGVSGTIKSLKRKFLNDALDMSQ